MKTSRWLFLIAIASVTLIAWSSGFHRISHPMAIPAHLLGEQLSDGVSGTSPQAFAGVLTGHNDNARDGLNAQETILTPSNVNKKSFGLVFSYAVDGYLWAQPLYVPQVNITGYGLKNVAYVATGHDSVFAFDADGVVTTPLWQISFLNPSQGISTLPQNVVNCPNGPEYGITSTPVIDPVAGLLYVIATTYSASLNQAYFTLHALELSNGAEAPGSPVSVTASSNGKVLSAFEENSRPALLLANGNIYMGFGSNCDNPPFNGWILAYNASTLQQVAGFLVTPKGREGGIWMSGNGMCADDNGSVYVSTSNGSFDVNVGGPDFGDSVIQFGPSLSVLDYFTPYNQETDQLSDLDVGSAGHMLLPPQKGPHPNELITGSKGGTVYLLDRDNMGHYNPDGDDIIQEIGRGAPSGMYSGFAYWNGNVYSAAFNSNLRQYPVVNGLLTAPERGLLIYPFPGSTPSISSNGNDKGIVWTIINGTPSVRLHASSAQNASTNFYDSATSVNVPAVKFAPPTIANGRVYVGTQTQLLVFGLLP
jgi:hypothetical protein